MHYHGDYVRRLFILGGVVMLVSLPWVENLLPFPLYISLIAIVILAIAASITNPLQKWIHVANVIISALAFLIFEYYAIQEYRSHSWETFFFVASQTLAVIFFIALYYAGKTARASHLKSLVREE